ncbi:MAG: BrnA antitoxin family protein [Fimbriimonadales bacterium]|nr:BrnA antitoxin family protein [Fimbriimonadales bacterium]
MAIEITVRLPEGQVERLQRLAQARGVSLETYIAEVVAHAAPEPAHTLQAWQEFLTSLEPLSEEQKVVLERESTRHPLFEGRTG